MPRLGVKSYPCTAKYGYAWVCLGEPLAPIPEVPEDTDGSYRRIQQFHDDWKTSPFRLMENSFDNAHFAFVHKSTFGQMSQPVPEKLRDQRNRLRLRGRDHHHHRQPADGASDHRHERRDYPAAICATSGSCPSADGSTSNTRRGSGTSSSTRRRRSTMAISSSPRSSIATTRKRPARRKS